jgi:peptidoglycan/LPS O-acetylase OafA/YrhL
MTSAERSTQRSNASEDPHDYVAALTGLRAIAAALVMFFHFFEAARVFNGAELPWITWVMGNGQNGVTVFFALSGFLITIRYRDALQHKRVGFKAYWLRRFARIYPSYFVACFVLSVLPQILFSGSTAYANPLTWLGLLLMGQALFLPLFALGVPIGWTLTLEEIFYVVAPRLTRWLQGGLLKLFVTGTVVVVLCATGLWLITRFPQSYAFSEFNEEFIFAVSFVARAPEFVAGMIAGLLFLDHRARFNTQAARVLLIASVPLTVVCLQLANHFVLADALPSYAFFRLAGAIGASALMLSLSLYPRATALARFLGSPVMDYLGKSSYALYLVHLTWPLQQIWSVLLLLPIHPTAAVPLMYLASVAASIVLYECVEKPMHRRLSH